MRGSSIRDNSSSSTRPMRSQEHFVVLGRKVSNASSKKTAGPVVSAKAGKNRLSHSRFVTRGAFRARWHR